MSMAVIGLVAGMALGFAGYFGGFGAFLLVAALGAVGFVAGRFLDGDLEPGDFFRVASATTGGGDGVVGGTRRGCPAAERGATRIADRVVAKIAAQAAREALDDAARRTARPRTPPSPCTTTPPGYGSASSSDYPSDIGGQCGAVRRHVVERVKALAGMEVPEVAVQVERLHPAQSDAARHRGGSDERAPGPGEQHRAPAHRRPCGTRRSSRPSDQSASARLRTRPAADEGRRRQSRPLLVRAPRSPPGSSRWWSSAARALLLYDVAAVRADQPAMHWRRSLADELAERPLDDMWVLVGAGVAMALGLWLIVLAATPGLRDLLPMRRDRTRRTGRTRPGPPPPWSCATGPWRCPACSRSGSGWDAPRSRCAPSRTSVNSTTYAPTWTPRSTTGIDGLGLAKPPEPVGARRAARPRRDEPRCSGPSTGYCSGSSAWC